MMAMIAAALTIVFVLLDRRFSPWATVLAHPATYVLAHLLHSEGVDPGGGRTDNAWWIWIVSYVAIVTVVWIVEKLFHVEHRR